MYNVEYSLKYVIDKEGAQPATKPSGLLLEPLGFRRGTRHYPALLSCSSIVYTYLFCIHYLVHNLYINLYRYIYVYIYIYIYIHL